jgi:hypothetical protein
MLGLAPIPYPFLPRHLSLASFFVTGVPPFFLALAGSSGPWRMGDFLRDVTRFAAPAALALAVGVVASYTLALEALDLGLVASRSVAVSVFVAGFLYVVFALEATDRRRASWVGAMCVALLGLYAVVFAISPLRELFELEKASGTALGLIALGLVLAIGVLTAAGIRPRLSSPSRRSASGT